MAKKKAEEMEVEIQETAEETTPKKAAKKTTKKASTKKPEETTEKADKSVSNKEELDKCLNELLEDAKKQNNVVDYQTINAHFKTIRRRTVRLHLRVP